MKYYISDKKLQLVLDELAEEYKDLLIEKLLLDFKTKDVDSLPLSELLKLDVSIKDKLIQNKEIEKKKKFCTMLISMGIIYCMLGILILFFEKIRHTLYENPMDMISLLFIMIGIIVSFYGVISKAFTNKKSYYIDKNNYESNYEFVSLWKEVEGLMIQLYPDNKIVPPFKLIQYLSDNNFISNSEEVTIKSLLRLRNEAVHSSSSKSGLTAKEYAEIMKNARALIVKLNSFAN